MKPTPEFRRLVEHVVKEGVNEDRLAAIYAEVYEQARTVECEACEGAGRIVSIECGDGHTTATNEKCNRCHGTGRVSIRADERRKVLELCKSGMAEVEADKLATESEAENEG